jgi:DNA-binding NarL/FixJ family response regulator
LKSLKLMAKGKSNKEIASALFISEGTVKSHGKTIFAKDECRQPHRRRCGSGPARLDQIVTPRARKAAIRAMKAWRFEQQSCISRQPGAKP